MKVYKQKEIERDLKNLGITTGDVVYVKVDLLKVGLIKDNVKFGFLDALLSAVGPEGTIITAAYTKTYFFPFFKKNRKIFELSTLPNTGAFSTLMLQHPRSVRSVHPTNSYVSVGKYANELLKNHNQNSSSFEPLRAVMELGGKCIIVGCIDSNPGHTTTHLAQYDLGFATQNNLRGLVGANYWENGVIKTFLRKDFGGHAIGARKIYSYYLDAGILMTGFVGSATALWSPAKEAYDLDMQIIRADKKFLLCNSPACLSCRVTWRYNKKDILKYVLNKIIAKSKRLLKL